jgi:pantoate--beta-alanine ligase
VAYLYYPVPLRLVPIVRSEKGLALSSRKALLSEEEKEAALVLHRAIKLIADRAARHEPLDIEDAIGLFQMEPLVELDYFVVVDPNTLQELAFNCQDTPFTGEGLILVAATVGKVRLIDNQPI